MQTIGSITQNLTAGLIKRTATSVKCWKDSTERQVKFCPIAKKVAIKIWHTARKWDRSTQRPRKHGGVIGRAALSVLYTLIHDYLNFSTGRLDPSVANIARYAGICERTCHTALKKLRAHGIINWQRRCETVQGDDGHRYRRQLTNAYEIIAPKHWIAYKDDDPQPLPGDLWGATPPMPDLIAQALDLANHADRRPDYRLLEADPNDRLALALSGLGRAMGAI